MSFDTSLAWLIVSKASLRSKKQAPKIQPESILRLISSTNVKAASSVDLFFLKPNWKSEISLFSSIKPKIVYEFFSITFDTSDKMETGR